MHATLTTLVLACDCCGKQGLKRAIAIHTPNEVLYLGVICAGRWFGVPMRGDPNSALKRLNGKLRLLKGVDLENIARTIREGHWA